MTVDKKKECVKWPWTCKMPLKIVCAEIALKNGYGKQKTTISQDRCKNLRKIGRKIINHFKIMIF